MKKIFLLGIILFFLVMSVEAQNRNEEALRNAAKRGDLEIVKWLVTKRETDVNAQDRVGQTALFWSALDNQKEMAEFLLKNGGKINIREITGASPLIAASTGGHTEMVAYLLAAGANIDLGDYQNWSALMWASLNGHHATVRSLLNQGANVNQRGNTTGPL